MTKQEFEAVECYCIPAQPLPLLLPVECVADIVDTPNTTDDGDTPVAWMKGNINWNNRAVPVISFQQLTQSESDGDSDDLAKVAVLNPIPHAARMAHTGLSFFGEESKLTVDIAADFSELPEGIDRRYVESVVEIDEQHYLIPKLPALAVAFSYAER